MVSEIEKRIKILEYVRENSLNKSRINKSDVMRHLKDISRLNTTHRIVRDLIKEGKIKMVKDKPYSQTHYLVINENDEFNRVNKELSEIEIIMDSMDERINEISKRPEIEKIPKNKRDMYRYEFEQHFLIELFMNFAINIIRISKMKTQKDTEILYGKIIYLMLKMDQSFSKSLSWDLLETNVKALAAELNDDNLPRWLNGELV